MTAITTNYDSLYEDACRSTDATCLRIPWEAHMLSNLLQQSSQAHAVSVADNRALPIHLLKLHGCISRPETIVLTRQDYMRYEDKGRALRGVVQQELLYKDVLFIGCSMTDGART
jgi:hypothetical protein